MAEELNWGDGNYERTARTLEPTAEVVLDTAEVTPGERVLDVACGTGNAALAAAQRGTRTVGVDPAEALLTIARDRATAVGADAEFSVGGALDLPGADAAFDAVVSVFGVIFAPDAERAAAELLRATRPGGRVVLTSWVPSGPISAVGRALFSALPASAAAPARWGDPEWLARHSPATRGQRRDPRAHPALHGRVARRVVCRSRPAPPRLGVGPATGHRRALETAARRERGTAERRQRGPRRLSHDEPLPRGERSAVRAGSAASSHAARTAQGDTPMLIRPAELDAIRAGRIDLAFRRWDRPRLQVGTRMRTAIGLVEATAVDVIAVGAISDPEARRAGAGSREELLAGLARHPERPVFRIGLRFAGPDPRIALREDDDLSDEEHARLVVRLDRLDRTSRHGPWTRATLATIDRRPATRAAELAHELGRETMAFKRDVRKLKELGLTESLDTGYRLSPRARALLQRS